jgi:hypothetical protein
MMYLFATSRCLVSKDDVSVASNYNFNHYHDGKELNYFLSMDRINALVVLPLEKVNIINWFFLLSTIVNKTNKVSLK